MFPLPVLQTLADSRPRIKGRFAKVHVDPKDQIKQEPKRTKSIPKAQINPVDMNTFARSCSVMNLKDYEEIIAFNQEDDSDVLLERQLDPGDDASSALTQVECFRHCIRPCHLSLTCFEIRAVVS